MVLLIDNYDSFTYNVVEYLRVLKQKILIYKNDDPLVLNEDFSKIDHIIISPGPKKPEDAEYSIDIAKKFSGKKPILGICLGHQILNYVFGGTLMKGNPAHGIVDPIYHNEEGLFKGIKNPLMVTRYHSLSIDEKNLNKELKVTSRLEDNTIMSIENREKMLYGVQFHPEAILTEAGYDILNNFLRIKNEK